MSASISSFELAKLRQTIEDLSARVAALEEGLGGSLDRYMQLGLSPHRARILALLATREFVSNMSIWIALYGNRFDDDAPDVKILDVHIWAVRKFLRLHNITIRRQRAIDGQKLESGGIYIDAAARAQLARMLSELAA